MAERARRRRTQKERRDESERRMLEAGVRLIAEGGLEALRLADIGIAAGYSRGLPAHHFGSKAKFQEMLGEFIIQEYYGVLTVPKGLSGLAALLEVHRQAFEQCRKNALFLRAFYVVLSSTGRTKGLSDELETHRTRATAMLERLIREGVRNGEIRRDVNPRLMSFVLSQSIGSVVESMLGDPHMDIQSIASQVLELLRHGLEAPPS